MIPVNNTNDLVVHGQRRAKFLADRPVKGEVMFRDGKPVAVLAVDNFSFKVKVQSAGGIEWVPFDELTRNGD